MKKKEKILKFLHENRCMINSLMSHEEKESFNGDVVGIICNGIEKERNVENGRRKETGKHRNCGI